MPCPTQQTRTNFQKKKVKRMARWAKERFFLIVGRLIKFGFPLGSDRGILNIHYVMI
ncbi:MAG: hypothetical protein ACOC7P_00455 [Chloroflexota bacterium]